MSQGIIACDCGACATCASRKGNLMTDDEKKFYRIAHDACDKASGVLRKAIEEITTMPMHAVSVPSRTPGILHALRALDLRVRDARRDLGDGGDM